MNQEEREQAAQVLNGIPLADWERFLGSDAGEGLRLKIKIAKAALRQAGAGNSSNGKPVQQILDLLGDRLLCDYMASPAIRAMIVRSVAPQKWERLREAYWELESTRARPLRSNAGQERSGAQVVASHWRQGGHWARKFCEICELPQVLAARRPEVRPEDEAVESVVPLPPLHDYQQEVYETLRGLLRGPTGQSVILSLPTGAGKTRVAVEAILDHLAQQRQDCRNNVVLWLSHSDELLRQAWSCFRQVWQTPPQRWDEQRIARHGVLHLRRAWGGNLDTDQLGLDADATVVFSGVQQLRSWTQAGVALGELWPNRRLACVVIDEAHRVITAEYAEVLNALGVKKQHRWEVPQTSPVVLGLTATPWRSSERQSESLERYFGGRLLTPAALGRRPVEALQKKGFLSWVQKEDLDGGVAPPMTPAQRHQFEAFHDLPPEYLAVLGREPDRNAWILQRLLKLPKRRAVLVFACSVEHGEILTLALNQAGRAAACIHAQTPRDERLASLKAFQDGALGFLCNYGVLTTGFDAPRVDVVCIARPTASELLYEQMVGRGLRGQRTAGRQSAWCWTCKDRGSPAS